MLPDIKIKELNGIFYYDINFGNWKYKLVRPYRYKTKIKIKREIDLDYIKMLKDGTIIIKKGYSWNGQPFGIDTNTNMRASLVYNFLHQLLRLNFINKKYKSDIINIFKSICEEDGMCKFRIWYSSLILRIFN